MTAKKERKSKYWPDMASFWREGHTWADRQICFDAALPPQAMRVCNVIRMHMNFEKGCSEVCNEAIATSLGISTDTVSRVVKVLDRRGHADVEYGRGRSQTNRIRWIVKEETNRESFAGLPNENITGLTEKNAAALQAFIGSKNPAPVRSFFGENTANETGKHRKQTAKTPHQCGTNNNTNNNTNKGDGAVTRQSPIETCSIIIDVVENSLRTDAEPYERGSEALEAPPAATAVDIPDGAAEIQDGAPMTLADLEALDAEEAQAAASMEQADDDGADWFSNLQIGGDPRSAALAAVIDAHAVFTPVPLGMGEAVFAAKWATEFALGGDDPTFRATARHGAVIAFNAAGRAGGKAGAAEWWENHRVALHDYAVANGASVAAAAAAAAEYTQTVRDTLSEVKSHAS